jgi:hypothetical protein
MQPERFHVEDPDKIAWGKLVKQWIKGEVERPHTIADLKTQCEDCGFTPVVPSYITGLVFVQNDKHVLTIRLPPKEILVAGEQDFIENPDTTYPIPSFYNTFFRDPPPKGEEKLDLQAARVGEYSVNSCL